MPAGVCRVGLLFEIQHAETQPGEVVGLVGNRPELGMWAAHTSAVRLSTGQALYPAWAQPTPVWITVRADGEEDGFDTASSLSSDEDDDFPDGSPCDAFSWRSGWRRRGSRGDLGAADVSSTLRVEYKYVKEELQGEGGQQLPNITWEDSICNRSVEIPLDPGSIWTISDSAFNAVGEPPKVTRTSLAHLLGDLPCSKVGHAAFSKCLPFLPCAGGRGCDDDSCNSTRSSLGRHSTSTVAVLRVPADVPTEQEDRRPH